MRPLISPSVLAADFANLQSEIQMLNSSQADWIHFDVMDGIFVPNISFGFPILEAIKKYAQKELDVHLMIREPERYIQAFQQAGADIITVHYEACTHLHRTVQFIKTLGAKASVCLNPHTPVAVLEDIINEVDMVLLMSVNPGFGGQSFIKNTYEKVAQLRELIDKSKLECLIEVDGGVTYETGKKLFESGADVLVSGSFVFGSANPAETIRNLRNL